MVDHAKTLTIGELCQRWQISRWSLRRMRRAGEGPAYFVIEIDGSQSIRYLLSSVKEFEGRQQGGQA